MRALEFWDTFKFQFAQSILSMIITATLFAFVFVRWIFMVFPTGWGIHGSVVFAAIIAFILGVFSRLWIRNPILLAVSGFIALISGAAWAEYSVSDVTITFGYAIIYSLGIWWRIEFLLFLSLMGAWFIANYSLKKLKSCGPG